MARFRFQLEPVLRHRASVERQKQTAVAALERDRLALEGIIRASQGAIEAERSATRALLLGRVDLAAARRQGSAAAHHAAAARQAALRLAGVHQRLAAARAELLEAAKRRKAVELLKERRYQQWRADETRRDAGAIDELVVSRAGRPAPGEPES